MAEEKSGIFGDTQDTSSDKECSGLFPNNRLTSLDRYTKSLNENLQVEISEEDND